MKQKYCLVDTNVPLTADKLNDCDMEDCAHKCVAQMQEVMQTYGLVLDNQYDIMHEYQNRLAKQDKQSVSYAFFIWINNNNSRHCYVNINKIGDSYKEFPTDSNLENFDPADRKFIAVANAYKHKPISIFQATDSKWLRFKDTLQKIGIHICFVCEEYAQRMYEKKMG